MTFLQTTSKYKIEDSMSTFLSYQIDSEIVILTSAF